MGTTNKNMFSRCENTCVKMKRKKKLCFVNKTNEYLRTTDSLILKNILLESIGSFKIYFSSSPLKSNKKQKQKTIDCAELNWIFLNQSLFT